MYSHTREILILTVFDGRLRNFPARFSNPRHVSQPHLDFHVSIMHRYGTPRRVIRIYRDVSSRNAISAKCTRHGLESKYLLRRACTKGEIILDIFLTKSPVSVDVPFLSFSRALDRFFPAGSEFSRENSENAVQFLSWCLLQAPGRTWSARMEARPSKCNSTSSEYVPSQRV